MTTFQKIKIKEYCEITSSKRIFAGEYLSSGVPFYRGKEISQKQKSSSDVTDQIFISRKKFEEIKLKYGVPQKGDLLLTSVGTIGNPYLVKENEEFYFKDGNLTWFRNFKGISGRWLYYWLLSPQGKSELSKCTIGSSQKAYTITLLNGLEIELPEIKIQTNIALVLSAYDDLIENNEKRTKILEEMAQLLYTEWFVKFKFPGYEKIKMVDSKTEFGLIPDNCSVEDITDSVEFIRGVEPGSANYNTASAPGLLPFLRVGDLGSRNSELFIEKSEAKGKIIKRDDIAVTMDGTVGRVAIGVCGAYSTGIRKLLIKDRRINREFLYFLMISDYMQDIMKAYAKGAIILHASESIKYMKFVLPTKELMSEFGRIVKPTIDQILNLQDKNRNLSKTRDLLIPQLVTGRREVKLQP